MTREEKIAIADMVRSRDRFGPVSPEELAALPGKEQELWVHTKNGKTVHVFEERPDNLPEQAALLLNFHGGGFLKGRTDRDRRYCCWVMEQLNCMVWDVDYSLAPEAPFPFAAEEAYEIVSYVFEHAAELVIDKEPANIKDGFVLVYGEIEENCTLKALFDSNIDRIKDIANKQLFG
mgnify:CR=1 FL=1